MQPTVYVGSPEQMSKFEKYEDNEISVYVQKGLEIPKDELLITTSTFLWFEKLAVIGMI